MTGKGGVVDFVIRVSAKAALALGKDRFGNLRVSIPAIEIPEDLKEFLEVSPTAGSGDAMAPVDFVHDFKKVVYPEVGEATKETLLRLLIAAKDFKEQLQKAEQDRIAKDKEVERIASDRAARVSARIEAYTPEQIAGMSGDLWIGKSFSGPHRGNRCGGCPEPFSGITRKDLSLLSDAAREVLKRAMVICDERDAAEAESFMAERRVQLNYIVERLGSDVQKEKWKDGFMTVSEVIELWERDAAKPFEAAGYKVVPADEWIGGGPDKTKDTFYEEEVSKISDARFLKLKEVKALAPPNAQVVPSKETYRYADEISGVGAGRVSVFFFKVTWKEGRMVMRLQVVPQESGESLPVHGLNDRPDLGILVQ